MKDSEKRLPIPQIMIIMGTAVSLSYLAYCEAADTKGADTMDAGLIAIAVALIGVAGGIWGQVVQFKKDSGKIGDIKSDTSALRPKTDQIHSSVEKIRDSVVEKMVPTLDKLQQTGQTTTSGVQALVDDLNYQQRLKQDISTELYNKDQFLGGIEKLYEENGRLLKENRELKQELNRQKQQNRMLNAKNKDLEDRLGQYERPRGHDLHL